MCEIFFLKKTKGVIGLTELYALTEVAARSARENPDGWGFFTNDGVVYKNGKTFAPENLTELADKARGAKYVVLHLRKTTCGKASDENSHPFVKDGWTLVHNGILNTCIEPDKVDSQVFLERIVAAKGETEVEKIQNALKENSGWLSIFVKSPSNKLYYFRQLAQFEFGLIPEADLLIGATKKERLEEIHDQFNGGETKLKNFFRATNNHLLKRTPEENVIYVIDAQFSKIGEFRTKPCVGAYGATYCNYGFWSRKYGSGRGSDKKKRRDGRKKQKEEDQGYPDIWVMPDNDFETAWREWRRFYEDGL